MRLGRLGGDHHVGAVPSGFEGDGLPDAAARSCDEERAAGELPVGRQQLRDIITTNN